MLPGIPLDMFSAEESVKVDKSRCVHMRFAGTGCRHCLDICPQQAIALEPGPTIDSGKCSGCLLCESACPTGVFASGNRLVSILAQLGDVAAPVLGCNHQEGVEAHARVRCLGQLASPDILLSLAFHLPNGVALNLTRCSDCPNSFIVAKLTTILEGLSALPDLQIHKTIRLVENQQDLRFREKGLSRRELFSFFRQTSTATAISSIDRLQKSDKPLPYRYKKLPQSRSLLLTALPEMSKTLRQAVETRMFPQATFHNSCRACSGCVGICPTGGLAPTQNSEDHPQFNPACCTSCGLCESFCKRGGITLSRQEPEAHVPRVK